VKVHFYADLQPSGGPYALRLTVRAPCLEIECTAHSRKPIGFTRRHSTDYRPRTLDRWIGVHAVLGRLPDGSLADPLEILKSGVFRAAADRSNPVRARIWL